MVLDVGFLRIYFKTSAEVDGKEDFFWGIRSQKYFYALFFFNIPP